MKRTSREKLDKAVVGALHNWSHVELGLESLFASLMGIESSRKTSAVFATIISFDARIAICNRLMETEDLDAPDQALWGRFSARISKLYKKRHELAHFTVFTSTDENRSLIAPFVSAYNLAEKNIKMLDAKQIKERSDHFVEVIRALEWLCKYLTRRRLTHAKFEREPLEEPGLIVRLRALGDQNPAKQ